MTGQLNPAATRVDVEFEVTVGVDTAAVNGISVGTVVVSAAGKVLDPVAPCDFGMTEQDAHRSDPRVKAMIEK